MQDHRKQAGDNHDGKKPGAERKGRTAATRIADDADDLKPPVSEVAGIQPKPHLMSGTNTTMYCSRSLNAHRRDAVDQDTPSLRERRRSGSLEAEVMAVLWGAEGALTPSDVQRGLGRDLAYTTVMTTLSRLHAKGVVLRDKAGRAFAYRPAQGAEDHAAEAMAEVLARGIDPAAVLSRFVNRLGPEEEALLRELLDREKS